MRRLLTQRSWSKSGEIETFGWWIYYELKVQPPYLRHRFWTGTTPYRLPEAPKKQVWRIQIQEERKGSRKGRGRRLYERPIPPHSTQATTVWLSDKEYPHGIGSPHNPTLLSTLGHLSSYQRFQGSSKRHLITETTRETLPSWSVRWCDDTHDSFPSFIGIYTFCIRTMFILLYMYFSMDTLCVCLLFIYVYKIFIYFLFI